MRERLLTATSGFTPSVPIVTSVATPAMPLRCSSPCASAPSGPKCSQPGGAYTPSARIERRQRRPPSSGGSPDRGPRQPGRQRPRQQKREQAEGGPALHVPVPALLSSAGVAPIRLPASSPNLDAYAERFVRSIKSECLNKLVLLGENHLRAAIREYLLHYHQERNHQGLAGQLILPPANLNRPGPIVCRERLGGLLRFYHRNAA
jgi:hypothetical protein